MDITLLTAIAVVLVAIIGVVTFFFGFRGSADDAKEGPRQQARPVPNRVRDGAPRRAQLARNRGARLRANAAAHQHDAVDADEPEHAEEREQTDLDDSKLGAKKKAKLEAKAEKKAAREAEERIRVDRKKQDKIAEEERRKAEDKEKEDEKRREEEERKAKEEKERKEYEEYLKMKEAFSVEEEGFEEGEIEGETNLLQEFVKYIKNNKVVLIEDLAAHFKLKTQAAIDRIKDLQNDEILSGVIDDRGKFIYISEDEMVAVAKFIRQRGRVSITELAENSNRLINLIPASGAQA